MVGGFDNEIIVKLLLTLLAIAAAYHINRYKHEHGKGKLELGSELGEDGVANGNKNENENYKTKHGENGSQRSGNAENEKEVARAAIKEFMAKIKQERKTSDEDWQRLVRAMQEEKRQEKEEDAVRDPAEGDDGAPPSRDLFSEAQSPSTNLLISSMLSAGQSGRLDSANWDDSADWGDTDLVAPRPAEEKREPRLAQKMPDIAEDRAKSWEGGRGTRPAFDSEKSTALLMDRMERLGDELLAEVDGWEDDEDDFDAYPSKVGGRREGPRRKHRDTNAILLSMEAINVELAAEMDHLNGGNDYEKKNAAPSAVSKPRDRRITTELLDGMEDLGNVLKAPRKTTLEGLSEQ